MLQVSDPLVLTNMQTPDEREDAENPLLAQWPAKTLKDARRKREPALFFVDKLIREGSLSIVFGAPGSLKSLLLMDMLGCILSRQPWLAPLPDTLMEQEAFPTSYVPCMWIDYDNGEDLTDERFEALANTYDLPDDAPLTYYSLALPWLDLSKAANANNLVSLIERKQAKVIVIDNLGLIKGGASENTDEMQPVMSHLRQIANKTRTAIILIHHQRKGMAGASPDSGARRGETLRGYSGIEASCDLVLHVDRQAGKDSITLTPTKVRRSKPFELAGALFTYDNSSSDVLLSARFWGQAVNDPKRAFTQQVKATIRDAVAKAPGINQGKLIENVVDWFATAGSKKPGRDLVRGTIKNMVETGEIIEKASAEEGWRKGLCYYPK